MCHQITVLFADYDYKATAKVTARSFSEHAQVVMHIKKQEARLAKAGVNTTAMFSSLLKSKDPVVVDILSRSQAQFFLPWRCPLHGSKLLNAAVRATNHTHEATLEQVAAIILQVRVWSGW